MILLHKALGMAMRMWISASISAYIALYPTYAHRHIYPHGHPIKHTCDVKHEKDCQKYFNIFLIHWQSQFHLTDLWHLHCISLNRKLEPVKKSFKGISSYWRITRAIFTKKFLSSPLFAMWPNICAKLFGMIPFSSGTDLQQMLSKFYENVMNKNILL